MLRLVGIPASAVPRYIFHRTHVPPLPPLLRVFRVSLLPFLKARTTEVLY